jgi:hypothetical protein
LIGDLTTQTLKWVKKHGRRFSRNDLALTSQAANVCRPKSASVPIFKQNVHFSDVHGQC